jgi:hypothetical protein
MLEQTPIARPVIYTLAGCAPGERCVIERTEDGARTREHDTGAANDWLVSAAGWEGRLGADKVFTASYEDASDNSRQRREMLAEWRGDLARANFSWIAPPVLNLYTRLAVEMCPAHGILRAVGYELAGGKLPQAVTLPCEVGPQALAA